MELITDLVVHFEDGNALPRDQFTNYRVRFLPCIPGLRRERAASAREDESDLRIDRERSQSIIPGNPSQSKLDAFFVLSKPLPSSCMRYFEEFRPNRSFKKAPAPSSISEETRKTRNFVPSRQQAKKKKARSFFSAIRLSASTSAGADSSRRASRRPTWTNHLASVDSFPFDPT